VPSATVAASSHRDGYYHDSFDYDALRETILGPGRVHEEAECRYRMRYQPGQPLYFAEARPLEAADVVVVNDDPATPAIRTSRAGPAPR
jgi:uridine kinase